MQNTTVKSPKPSTPFTDLELILIGLSCILCIVAFGLLYYQFSKPASTASGTAQLIPTDTPVQHFLFGADTESFDLEKGSNRWTLTPRASYQISARVLGNKRYIADWQAPLVPRDLALAWGDLSDPAVDEWIRWRQSGRWYYYTWDGDSPNKGWSIRTHSANVHIIPATENLARAFQDVEKGDVVYMEGELVDIDVVLNGRSYHASSSLTRKDTGAGGCEVFYVEELILNGQSYQ